MLKQAFPIEIQNVEESEAEMPIPIRTEWSCLTDGAKYQNATADGKDRLHVNRNLFSCDASSTQPPELFDTWASTSFPLPFIIGDDFRFEDDRSLDTF